MRSDGIDFCAVCADTMTTWLDQYIPKKTDAPATPQTQFRVAPIVLAGFGGQPPPQPLPPAPPPSTDRAVRMIVQLTQPKLNDITATTTIVKISDVTIPIVQRMRRVGDYVYGVIEGGNALDAAVLPGDIFQQREYGGISAPHGPGAESLVTRVTVLIPHVAVADLLTRTMTINFYRLDPAFGRQPNGARQNVTPETIRGFVSANRPWFAQVTTAQLRTAAMSPP